MRVAVQVADETIEIQEIPMPDLQPDEVLVRIEGCGMCGSDLESYRGKIVQAGLSQYPHVPGHEPVGHIERIPDDVAKLWGVGVGDRVAIEPFVPCGVCPRCLGGEYRLCANRFIYSCQPTTQGTGLWGGFAEYMVLRPNSVVHKVPDSISIQDAVLFNPFGAGFEWAYKAAGTTIGDTVLILGPGQRGLGSIVACREAGAEQIIVTGTARDATKLELAKEFGATDTIVVEETDTVERVMALTGGYGADRVVDTTSSSTQPVLDAVEAARAGGTIVLAGLKDAKTIDGFISDKLVFKDLSLRGALGVSQWAFSQAIRVIASGRYPLHKMHTHTFDLADLEHAHALLSGNVPGEEAIHITVTP
ncbi:MAG: alcohol dehydrogenase catalytic domain-containing protein [bacterium]|nr:alcohol dehydrogenase catalytic domain-containing protein [bacterium]